MVGDSTSPGNLAAWARRLIPRKVKGFPRNLRTFAVGPGDIAFLPENRFHSIANVGDEPLRSLIFFRTEDPRVETIDLSQTFDNVPARVLAASVDGDPARFAARPKRGTVGIAPPVEDA